MTDLTNANPAAVLAPLDAAERLAEVEAERDALAEEVADMVPRDWHGLMTILADVYPETAFPTLPDHDARDAGPRIVSLLRRVDALAAKVERVRAMHRERPYADPELRAGAPSLPAFVCQHCWGQADAAVPHPCPTIRALDGTETDHG